MQLVAGSKQVVKGRLSAVVDVSMDFTESVFAGSDPRIFVGVQV